MKKKFVNSYLKKILSCIAVWLPVHFTGAQTMKQEKSDKQVFCFYYNWYGNPKHDGSYIHWAHGIINPGIADTAKITGGDNIASNFYPALGAYSSHDASVVRQHMKMMRKAGIDIVVVTWWNKGDFMDRSIPLILNEAAKNKLKVAFHIEPFAGRNAQTTKDAIQYIVDTYGLHPAFYRSATHGNKPFFFIYDSYLTPDKEWTSIRNTQYDAVVIGLWVKEKEEAFFMNSGFDGFYTYFASNGFTYGSNTANWESMQAWAKAHNKIFIPSVGPGYEDTRIRPWNEKTSKSRDAGKYYDSMFAAAIACNPSFISITSFNEWHEGTQIEPAVPFSSKAFQYLDYAPQMPDYYLKRTRYWVERFKGMKK